METIARRLDIKLDLLPGLEGLVAVHIDIGVVHKEIFAARVGPDETIPFGIIEPLDAPGWHIHILWGLVLATASSVIGIVVVLLRFGSQANSRGLVSSCQDPIAIMTDMVLGRIMQASYVHTVTMKTPVEMKTPEHHLVFNTRDSETDPDRHEGIAVEESKPELAPPPMYTVVFMNDDYTPMDFVVEVLEFFFSLDRESATRVMLAIHTQGRANVGRYSRDVAETKAMQVVDYAQQNQHPLMCKVEPVS